MDAECVPVPFGLKARRLLSGLVDVVAVSIALEFSFEVLQAGSSDESIQFLETNAILAVLLVLYFLINVLLLARTPGMVIMRLRFRRCEGREERWWRDAPLRGLGLFLSLIIWPIALPVFLLSPGAATIQDQLSATKIVTYSATKSPNTPDSA